MPHNENRSAAALHGDNRNGGVDLRSIRLSADTTDARQSTLTKKASSSNFQPSRTEIQPNTVTMPTVLDLAIPASPPKPEMRKKGHAVLMPIELMNGCSEENCSIESDDVRLTNAVRRHFLEHFGHRDLDSMVASYSKDAILIQVVNGERASYHGRDEIRVAFEEIFKLHPTVNSTFQLKHIVIHDRNAMVIWSAATPTHVFPQSSDNILFDVDGKILKHFFSCQMNDVYSDKPWYVDEE